MLSLLSPRCRAGGGGDGAVDVHVLVVQLQAELSKVQAKAADEHQANLTLAADLAVLERKQQNQVRAGCRPLSGCCLGSVQKQWVI